jgi:Ca2+-binding RTX toxin-like protein
MATFFVDSTGVVTTASTGSDSIYLQSGALKGTELLGLAGNDTINLTEGVIANTSAVGLIARAGAGDDLFLGGSQGLGAFSAGNHTLIAGAGNDTLTFSGANGDWLKGNEGADRVVLSGTGAFSAIALGAGADELILQSAMTVDRVALGDGHDKISASTIVFATAASLIGGAGKDTIDLTIATDSQASAYINGGAAQDSITLLGLEGNSTVKGMGGADTITLSGAVDGTTAVIAAGEGADLVTISGLGNGSTVRGGSGNDTIVFADNIDGVSASIFAGSDNDSIRFDVVSGSVGANDDYSKISIAGGLGADSIVFSSQGGIGSGTNLGTLTYSSFAESNLQSMDAFQLKGTVLSGATTPIDLGIDFADALTSVTVGEVSASVLLSDANFSGNITTNVVTLSGTYTVSSVTAVAGTVDTLTLASGKGGSVLFSTKGGEDYIFVQGGAAGTADDAVIGLGNLSGGGGLALAMASTTALTVTFSGQAA